MPVLNEDNAAPESMQSEERPKVALLTDPLVWSILLAVIAIDQVTKGLVTRALVPGQSWPDKGFFQITQARNSGTIFGLFQGQGFVLAIISFIAIAGLIVFFNSSSFRSRLLRLALGLMLGGAIGNLVDRIRLGFVVDFIHIGPWPIFNLSDSSIVVGIIIIAGTALFRPAEIHQMTNSAGSSPHSRWPLQPPAGGVGSDESETASMEYADAGSPSHDAGSDRAHES